VKNSKWYVTLRRYHPVSTNSDFGTFSVVRSDCTANAWCELSIRLDWWSAKGVQPSVFGYYFEVEVRLTSTRSLAGRHRARSAAQRSHRLRRCCSDTM
jgi:hypothetical protein